MRQAKYISGIYHTGNVLKKKGEIPVDKRDTLDKVIDCIDAGDYKGLASLKLELIDTGLLARAQELWIERKGGGGKR